MAALLQDFIKLFVRRSLQQLFSEKSVIDHAGYIREDLKARSYVGNRGKQE